MYVFSYARKSRFCSCDLDLDPMTLTCEHGLSILKMYHRTKMEFLGQGFQKLEHEQDRHTDTDRHTDRRIDRCDRKYYHPHSRLIIKRKCQSKVEEFRL